MEMPVCAKCAVKMIAKKTNVAFVDGMPAHVHHIGHVFLCRECGAEVWVKEEGTHPTPTDDKTLQYLQRDKRLLVGKD